MKIPQTLKTMIDEIIKIEGGSKVTNDLKDHGGLTKWGITQNTWTASRKKDWSVSVADSTNEQAVEIYAKIYLATPQFEYIYTMSPGMAFEMFDWSITSGMSPPIAALQRSLNSLNNNGAYYPDIPVNGEFGNKTIPALDFFVLHYDKEGLRYLAGMVKGLRRVFYMEISENDKTQEYFQNGWQSRIK